MKIKKILLGTDFSQPASLLVDCLPELKEKGLEEVVLIHVVNIRSAGGNAAILQKFNQDELKDLAKRIETDGFRVKTRVPIGFPPHEIVDAALEEQVSMILLGSIGKGVIRRVFMGSTSFDVIRISKVPVFIEKFAETGSKEYQAVCMRKFEVILVPVDFSKDSLDVLENIGELLQGKGKIVLVTVLEASDSEMDRVKKREEYEDKLNELKIRWEATGIEVIYQIREGNASTNILKVADAENATMIAMSKRGTGQIRELLIGSTAEAVALRSKIPVMLFPSNHND